MVGEEEKGERWERTDERRVVGGDILACLVRSVDFVKREGLTLGYHN